MTHAGRFGDALWALPTVRAISEAAGEPVDFCISHAYRGLVPLIQAQSYIRTAFSDATWEVQQTAPVSPAEPLLKHCDQGGRAYEKTVHLSFKGWPEAPTLAEGYWLNGEAAVPGLKALDLERPWIEVPKPEPIDIAIGFTDEYFEMKAGIAWLLQDNLNDHPMIRYLCAEGSRWFTEAGVRPTSWVRAANLIAGSMLFLGCLSALAVLAAALGKPRVLVEPNLQRHHAVFQHWDTELVKGGDGKPTFDARHVVDAVREKLS